MDLGSIFLILALALVVTLFVSRPFTDRKLNKAWLSASKPGSGEGRKFEIDPDKLRSSLLAEYERLLGALQELEFDFNLGKIPADDYPQQRLNLLQSGAAVLKELDDLEGDYVDEPVQARVEAEASRISLTGKQAAAGSSKPDELESLVAERRRKRGEKSAGFCPKCGKPVQNSDVFCPKCGRQL